MSEYKPCFFNRIIAFILLLTSISCYFYSAIVLFECICNNNKNYTGKMSFYEKLVILIKNDNRIYLIFMIVISISFIAALVSLSLIILKDDGNIRYAKLNELKSLKFHNNFSKDAKTIRTETMTYGTNEENGCNNTILKEKENLYTNYSYEFYKKYMDTLADI